MPGTPWSQIAAKGIPIPKKVMAELGECLISHLQREAKKDFAKKGWSGRDENGVAIWDSFYYELVGKSEVEILSTWQGINDYLEGKDPYPMEWLTQEMKDRFPSKYKLTAGERARGMKVTGKVLSSRKEPRGRSLLSGQFMRRKEGRLPLIVPLRGKSGTVIFRTAPLKTKDAWIHPGIARMMFMERALEKGQEECVHILGEYLLEQLVQGDPLR